MVHCCPAIVKGKQYKSQMQKLQLNKMTLTARNSFAVNILSHSWDRTGIIMIKKNGNSNEIDDDLILHKPHKHMSWIPVNRCIL